MTEIEGWIDKDNYEFKPQWDVLKSTQESLVEHMKMIGNLWEQLEATEEENEQLKARVARLESICESVMYHDNRYGRFEDAFYKGVKAVYLESPAQSLALHDAELLEQMADKAEEIDGGVNSASRLLYAESARLRNSVKEGE